MIDLTNIELSEAHVQLSEQAVKNAVLCRDELIERFETGESISDEAVVGYILQGIVSGGLNVYVVQGNDFTQSEACFLTREAADKFVQHLRDLIKAEGQDPKRIYFRVYEIPLFERFSDYIKERGKNEKTVTD